MRIPSRIYGARPGTWPTTGCKRLSRIDFRMGEPRFSGDGHNIQTPSGTIWKSSARRCGWELAKRTSTTIRYLPWTSCCSGSRALTLAALANPPRKALPDSFVYVRPPGVQNQDPVFPADRFRRAPPGRERRGFRAGGSGPPIRGMRTRVPTSRGLAISVTCFPVLIR